MVLSGLVIACRFATWPTMRSPDLLTATTDGVVRPPSAFAITVGSPPSMTATTLLVVPRSIPITRAIIPNASSISPVALPATSDHDHRRADDAIAEAIATLGLGHNFAFVAFFFSDRLVQIRIERLANRAYLGHAGRRQRPLELAQDLSHAFDPRAVLQPGIDVLKRPLEVVDSGQHVEDKRGVCKARILLAILLSAALEVDEVRRCA